MSELDASAFSVVVTTSVLVEGSGSTESVLSSLSSPDSVTVTVEVTVLAGGGVKSL